jgi:beta-lactamase class C
VVTRAEQMKRRFKTAAVLACLSLSAAVGSAAAAIRQAAVASLVQRTVRPLMQKQHIPGMAVGIVAGSKSYVLNYGVASTQTRKPVTDDTLFELGSISKTFTATLTAYAQLGGYLSLSDTTAKYLPSLRDSEFGKVTLLNLGTHTPGGLPLQVPDNVRNDGELLRYLKDWRPSCVPGACRTYTNLGIGTLGVITAKATGADFEALMGQLLAALGMKSSYIHVPEARMADYAEGYAQNGAPVRMTLRELSSEAAGIKSTAPDMVRFLEANMQMIALQGKLQRAIAETHIGYFQAGVMTQDLMWEQYPYPVALQTLLEGNSSAMLYDATPVTRITPPEKPRADAWINKTGSTSGFGAYIAFIPQRRLGIVILANRSYPIEARVTAAYEILTALAPGAPQQTNP